MEDRSREVKPCDLRLVMPLRLTWTGWRVASSFHRTEEGGQNSARGVGWGVAGILVQLEDNSKC